MEKEASCPPLWSRLHVLFLVTGTQLLCGQAEPHPLAALAGSQQRRRAKQSTDGVMRLAEPIHRTGQGTQTGDQGWQNCPCRGESASRLASAHHEYMCLRCMWCVWMQRGPARSFHKGSVRRTVVSFEQRPFDSMHPSECICLYLHFSHQTSLGTVFNMEIILLIKMSRPLLHAVSLDDLSGKLPFLTKEAKPYYCCYCAWTGCGDLQVYPVNLWNTHAP